MFDRGLTRTVRIWNAGMLSSLERSHIYGGLSGAVRRSGRVEITGKKRPVSLQQVTLNIQTLESLASRRLPRFAFSAYRRGVINNTFALLRLKEQAVTRKSPPLRSPRAPGNDGLFKDIKRRSGGLSYARI